MRALGALVIVFLVGMVVSMLVGYPIVAPAFLIGMVIVFGIWELKEKRDRRAGERRTAGDRKTR